MAMLGIEIWRERPGVISRGYCWCAAYGFWLHTSSTLLGLLWSLLTEWKHDRHLVG